MELNEQLKAAGYTELTFNQYVIDKQRFKNINAKVQEINKTPCVRHGVWLTHPSDPQEMRERDTGFLIDTKKLFDNSAVEWKHIVWVNDPNLIPSSVKLLESAGIEVKSIYEVEEELSLLYLVEQKIEEKKWGMASDILRADIIHKFGGVYADINFVFHRDVVEEAYTYDFLSIVSKGYYIDNFFFMAKPLHPIMQQICNLIERNINEPPQHLLDIDENSREFTYKVTAEAIYLAYYMYANQEGNVDVIYPKWDCCTFAFLVNLDVAFVLESSCTDGNERSVGKAPTAKSKKSESSTAPEYGEFNEYEEDSLGFCASESIYIGEDDAQGLTWLQLEC